MVISYVIFTHDGCKCRRGSANKVQSPCQEFKKMHIVQEKLVFKNKMIEKHNKQKNKNKAIILVLLQPSNYLIPLCAPLSAENLTQVKCKGGIVKYW